MKNLLIAFLLLTVKADASPLWLIPSAAVSRSSFTYDEANPRPGEELFTGLDLSLRLMSASAMNQTLRIGLDLRQGLGEAYSTKLGVHIDWHHPIFRIGAAWFFGDTLVANRRNRQFNGNSVALSAAAHTSMNWHPYFEYAFGSYHEGPGFIFLPRRPGSEMVETRSFLIGVEFPFEIETPEWLYR